jgi:hypothetical protein
VLGIVVLAVACVVSGLGQRTPRSDRRLQDRAEGLGWWIDALLFLACLGGLLYERRQREREED